VWQTSVFRVDSFICEIRGTYKHALSIDYIVDFNSKFTRIKSPYVIEIKI